MYDPLAGMFVALALVLQLELAKRPRLDVALVLGAVIAGGLLTKLTTSVALYLLPLSALVFDWSRLGLRRRLGAWLGYAGISLVIAWAGYQVLKLSDFYDDLGPGREVLAQHGVGEALSRPWHWLSANWPTYQDALLGYLTIPLVLAAVLGAVVGLRRTPLLAGLLACWFVLPAAAIVLLADFPYTRWLTVAIPALVPLLALGIVWLLDALRDRMPGSRGRVAVAAAVVVGFGPALLFDARVLATPTDAPYPGDDLAAFVTQFSAGAIWEDVADDLTALAAGRPVVVAAGSFCCRTLALELSDDPAYLLRPLRLQRRAAGPVRGGERHALATARRGPRLGAARAVRPPARRRDQCPLSQRGRLRGTIRRLPRRAPRGDRRNRRRLRRVRSRAPRRAGMARRVVRGSRREAGDRRRARHTCRRHVPRRPYRPRSGAVRDRRPPRPPGARQDGHTGWSSPTEFAK